MARAGGDPSGSGFLSDYAKTSLENDFNTYAETALADPDAMSARAGAAPVVAAKLRLLIEAYRALDERWGLLFAKFGFGASPIE